MSLLVGAKVIASTFDAYVAQLEQFPRANLTTETGEVGDVWITSTTADPVKMAWNRLASRQYAACVQSGSCDPQVRPGSV